MEELVTARLLDTFFDRISVERGPGARLGAGGEVKIAIFANMAESNDAANQVVTRIELDIVGIPTKSKDEKEFGFKANIVCAGRYEWPTSIKSPTLSREAVEVLCLPIYATAAAEVTRLVRSLEMGNLRLPGDLRSAREEANALAKKRPLAKRAATKPRSVSSASTKKV